MISRISPLAPEQTPVIGDSPRWWRSPFDICFVGDLADSWLVIPDASAVGNAHPTVDTCSLITVWF